jgi:hypothetical protein
MKLSWLWGESCGILVNPRCRGEDREIFGSNGTSENHPKKRPAPSFSVLPKIIKEENVNLKFRWKFA